MPLVVKRTFMALLVLVVSACMLGCAVLSPLAKPGQAQANAPQLVVVEEATFFATILIDGVDISGLTLDAARRKVEEAQKQAVIGKNITVRLGAREADIPVAGLPLQYDTEDVLEKAWNLGRTGDLAQQEAQREQLKAAPETFSTTPALSGAAQEMIERQMEPLYVSPVDAEVAFDFAAEEKITVKDSVEGKKVDAEALTAQILEMIKKGEFSAQISAPVQPVPALITTEDAKKNVSLVSSYQSSYKSGSGANRVFNLQKASDLINGTVLQPGEIFDTNGTLGPRSLATGWKAAHAINDGTYVDEPGGGVCQISSTLFNAVLMADLEIVERRPHSWPIGYIPIGRDATISTGGPNFRFKNNTAAPVYISMYLTTGEKTVTAEIYGMPLADGKTIQLSSEKTGSLGSRGIQYEVDETLAPNTTQEVRKERIGQRSVTYKEYYDAAGNLIEKQEIYNDTYPSFAGKVLVSADIAGGTSSPEATPAPAPEAVAPTPEQQYVMPPIILGPPTV